MLRKQKSPWQDDQKLQSADMAVCRSTAAVGWLQEHISCYTVRWWVLQGQGPSMHFQLSLTGFLQWGPSRRSVQFNKPFVITQHGGLCAWTHLRTWVDQPKEWLIVVTLNAMVRAWESKRYVTYKWTYRIGRMPSFYYLVTPHIAPQRQVLHKPGDVGDTWVPPFHSSPCPTS